MPEVIIENDCYFLEWMNGERVEFPTFSELCEYLEELKQN